MKKGLKLSKVTWKDLWSGSRKNNSVFYNVSEKAGGICFIHDFIAPHMVPEILMQSYGNRTIHPENETTPFKTHANELNSAAEKKSVYSWNTHMEKAALKLSETSRRCWRT